MKKSTNLKVLETRIAELEQEKRQLLKLVSHDVKSPFNKLFALSNLLQLTSDNLNDEQLDYLTRMEWVIKEGLTVVRNLLDLRAIENNDIDLQEEELSIDAIIRDTIKNYSKQIKTKNLLITSELDNVTARSDKRVLERVIDHLVSNAVKFTPLKGNVIIGLLANNSLVELEVSSSSGPIPEAEISKLFKQSSPLSTRPTHGENALGNGLFIAQKYAQELNGSIEFSQKEAQVMFKFNIPKNVPI